MEALFMVSRRLSQMPLFWKMYLSTDRFYEKRFIYDMNLCPLFSFFRARPQLYMVHDSLSFFLYYFSSCRFELKITGSQKNFLENMEENTNWRVQNAYKLMVCKLLSFYNKKNIAGKQGLSHQRGENNKETKRKQHKKIK